MKCLNTDSDVVLRVAQPSHAPKFHWCSACGMTTLNPSFKATHRDDVVRRGWRKFHCEECDKTWEWPTRDRFSPSGETCPECSDTVYPVEQREDASLPVGKHLNLLVPWNMTPEEWEARKAGESSNHNQPKP